MNSNDDQFGLDDDDAAPASGFGGHGASAIRGSVRVGKIEYAVELQWETPRDPAKAAKEAREYASGTSDRPDFYCIRKGQKTQFALGFASQGHKTNQPSLAAHIAQNKGANFVALFEVDGGFYMVGVRDDMILSHAERFVDGEEEAAQAFDALLGNHDWPEVIAPASFGISGATDVSIDAVLSGRAPVRLKDINRSSALRRFGPVTIVALIAILGGKYYFDQQEMLRIEEEAAEALRIAQERVGLQEKKIEIPPMPWADKVVGVKALESCFQQIGKFPLDIPGWKVLSVVCAPSSDRVGLSATLNRPQSLENGGAPLHYAMKAVEFNGLKPLLRIPAGGSNQQIEFGWASDELPVFPADMKTAKKSEITAAVIQVMETRRTTVRISPADNNEFWEGINIEFQTSASPMSFADLLGAIPAFMLESVKYDIDKNMYSIKGKAYEQLPPPVQAAQ